MKVLFVSCGLGSTNVDKPEVLPVIVTSVVNLV